MAEQPDAFELDGYLWQYLAHAGGHALRPHFDFVGDFSTYYGSPWLPDLHPLRHDHGNGELLLLAGTFRGKLKPLSTIQLRLDASVKPDHEGGGR